MSAVQISTQSPSFVVHDALHRLDFSMMDMPADHPVVALSAAVQRRLILEGDSFRAPRPLPESPKNTLAKGAKNTHS